MPPGFPYHAGGWFGGAPDDDLLPGWWATEIVGDWIFYREGRFGVESYYYTPRVMALVERIAPGHPLHANSFPIANGRWFPEKDVLKLLCVKLAENPPLVQWAYEDAGR